MGVRKHTLTDTTGNKTSKAYLDKVRPGGQHTVRGSMKEPRGRAPGKVTATTRSVDSHVYAEDVYPNGMGHGLTYGSTPDDQAYAASAHADFDDALMRNVNGTLPNRKISQNAAYARKRH